MKGKSCFGILFGLSIIAGIVLGKMIVPPQPLPITSTPPPEPKINDTILFIGVDHLDSTQPLLEGAWLVALDERNDHPADIIHIKRIIDNIINNNY